MMIKMCEELNIGALVSGGKDSIYALTLTLLSGKKVSCLINLLPKEDSWMFHHPYSDKVELIAKALGLPVITRKIESDDELLDLKSILDEAKKRFGINAIVTGAIASEYQRMRINLIAEELNLRVFSPLWHKDFEQLLREESMYLDVIIVKIMSEGLKHEILGKIIKEKEVEEILKAKLINPVFEGGEAETFCIYAPFYRKKIKLKNPKIISTSEYEAYLDAEFFLE